MAPLQAIRQVLFLMGSSEVLGNPLGTLSNIQAGVKVRREEHTQIRLHTCNTHAWSLVKPSKWSSFSFAPLISCDDARAAGRVVRPKSLSVCLGCHGPASACQGHRQQQSSVHHRRHVIPKLLRAVIPDWGERPSYIVAPRHSPGGNAALRVSFFLQSMCCYRRKLRR